ncbi:hypothetical protein LZ009_08940 [Ramlibacter sp. XY19]|uniref:hypothetical protein n=1 Tax=Ramlibacter paludis TaxID=2908000 RepID=UPI0023DA3C2B|nr:hypothetical protein [Ramlibacter paludis]MCG2592905.1 hypothetical protein [Ramlibacter paludis]
MMIPHVDVRLAGCEAEVWLNDIPVLRLTGDRIPPFATRPVAEFLRGSKNVLTVVPFPGPTPGTSRQAMPRQAAADAAIEAKLVLYEPGDFPGSGAGDDVITMVFGEGATQPLPTQPASLSTDGPAGLPPWGWERAARIDSDPRIRSAIGQFVQAAQTAFAAGDAAFFLRLARTNFQELAQAYPGLTLAEREQRFKACFAPKPGEASWQVAPLQPAEFDFRLCAEGRLLELVDRQFRPVIRGQSRHWPMRMFVGVLDGQLQVLR